MRREILDDWDASRFRKWFLHGLCCGDFHPIEMASDPSIPVQVRNLFGSNPRAREAMKDGLIVAIRDWSGELHGFPVLQDLARIAAFIRASESVSALARHLEGRYFKGRPDPDARDARNTLVAVIGGFAPSPDVEQLFSRLIDDGHYIDNIPQLFLGLCRCDRNAFPRFALRFANALRARPDRYRTDIIVEEVLKLLPPRLLAGNLENLVEEGAAKAFLGLLTQAPGFSIKPIGKSGDHARLELSHFEVRYPEALGSGLAIARLGKQNLAVLSAGLQIAASSRQAYAGTGFEMIRQMLEAE